MTESSWRMPAEWEPHEATWLSWPKVQGYSFAFNLEQVRPAFLEIIRALAGGEEVWINVNDPEEITWISERLEPKTLGRVHFFEIVTNEPWCRDHGPTFIIDDAGHRAAVSWQFNSWGGKYPPYNDDLAAAKTMAASSDIPIIAETLIMEGGAIESNGHGDILTSRSCLLDEARNVELDCDTIADHFAQRLGAKQTLWLDGVVIQGDDTDGHVDMTTRFTEKNRVLASLPEPNSPDFAALSQNLDTLRKMRIHSGELLEVETLPMLAPFYNTSVDEWAPRSYANFYIGNQCVLVPTYETPQDNIACDIIARHFPDRKIVPIDCREIVKGQGAVHCLTQQLPAIK